MRVKILVSFSGIEMMEKGITLLMPIEHRVLLGQFEMAVLGCMNCLKHWL